jgi:hypothetical protein
MAKLSARGRVEVVCDKETYNTTWKKTTVALMSDNKILVKQTVRFKPTTHQPKGELHDWGWKVKSTMKKEKTKEDFISFYLKMGYTQVK